jgi:hypothetical protein
MTREHALIIWRSMSPEQQKNLWLDNCKSDHFSKTWTFGMFAASTSIMWQAMSRKEETDNGILR